MKKITLSLLTLIASLSSFAIDNGTYAITGAPYTATITFDNTAERFTVAITGSPTTGYFGLGFASSDAGQMNDKYAFYITNNADEFVISEQILVDYGTGSKLLASDVTIESQDFAAGDITFSRSYATTNGGYSFNATDESVFFISSKGATVGAYHGGANRFKGAINLETVLSVSNFPELEGLQLFNSTENQSLGLKFPNTATGIYDVQVMNSVGQTVLTKQLDSNNPIHPFNELAYEPAGTYFVRLTRDGQIVSLKGIKN